MFPRPGIYVATLGRALQPDECLIQLTQAEVNMRHGKGRGVATRRDGFEPFENLASLIRLSCAGVSQPQVAKGIRCVTRLLPNFFEFGNCLWNFLLDEEYPSSDFMSGHEVR